MANIDKEELFGSFLPKPFIEKVSLNNEKINVKVVVKQNFQNAENSNLLEKLGLLDHFIVKLYEVTDGRISSLINFSKEFLFMLDGKGPTNPNVIKFASNFLQETNPEQVRKILLDSCTIRSKPFRLEQEEGFNEEDVEVLDDGTQVHNKYFSFSCEHSAGVDQLGHLTYYALVQLDDEFFIKHDITDVEIKKSYRSLIEVQGENIFNDFELTGESYVFLTEDSKIWPGDVYEKEGLYYTGLWSGIEGTEPANSRQLVRRIVRNNVIEDIRKREIIDKTAYNIRTYEQYIPKFSSKNANIDFNFVKKPEIYISGFNIDSVDNNICRGTFMFHANRFIKDNNVYMKQLSQESDFFNDLDLSIIKKIKIYRKRMLKRFSGDKEIVIPFSFNEIEKQIIDIGSVNATDSFSRENKNCSLMIYRNRAYNSFVIEFLDKEVSKFTDGYYQYSVEIETIDPSYNFAKQRIELLKEQSSNLQIYYNNSQEPKMFNFNQNKFKQEFNNEINQEYIINAISIFNQVRKDLTLEEDEELSLKISNMTSPATGTPEGILVFKKIVDNYIKNLELLIGDVNSPVTRQGNPNNSLMFRTNRANISMKYILKDSLWDSNRNTLVYDYGIDKKIQSSDFLNLVNEYLNEDASEEEKAQQMPFISPNRIFRGRRGLRSNENSRQLSKTLAAAKSIKSENEENIDFKEEFYELSRDYNVSIEEYDIPKTPEVKIVEQQLNSQVNRREVAPTGKMVSRRSINRLLNPASTEVFNKKPFIGQMVSIVNKIPRKQKPAPNKPGMSYKPSKPTPKKDKQRNKETVKRNIKNKLKDVGELTELEERMLPPFTRNVIKGDREKNNNKKFIPEQTLENFNEIQALKKINIGATKKIEVLTEFGKNLEGKIDPKKPKWETVSREVLDKFTNGTEVACRIVDFSESNIKIEDPTKGQKIKNSNFSMVIENNRVEEVKSPKIDISSGISKKSKTVKVEKESYEKVVKNNFEQTKFPPAVTKTVEVSKKTVSEAISQPKVIKEAQKKIDEKAKKTKKGTDKIGPKTAAATTSKKKSSKKTVKRRK